MAALLRLAGMQSLTSIRTVLRVFGCLLSWLCCGVDTHILGALEALKEEAAEHDSALKGLKKAKDRATKVPTYLPH